MEIIDITKSKLRREILRLYFSDPQKEYYLRELERVLESPVAYIRRELLKLEKFGLFKKRREANLLYFGLNKKHPLYNEIKSIVFKTIGVAGSLKKDLLKIPHIDYAFIFGSFAKREEYFGSDIDLMIIGNPDEDLLIKKISKLEEKLRREINYHIYSRSDLKKKIKEKNSFIINIIKGPKIFLIGKKDEFSKLYS